MAKKIINKDKRYLPSAYSTHANPRTPAQSTAVASGNRRKQRFNSRLQALEQQLRDICLEIYSLGEERLIPMNPFILVRLIPRDKMTAGGILIPDQGQNKPVFEGIVLETYRPYVVEETLRSEDGTSMGLKITAFECPLKPGDRVAFPYYEGVQKSYLGDDYRLIRQAADQVKFPYSQVLGILDYDGDKETAAQITQLMKKYYSVTTSGASASRGANITEIAK